MKYETEAKKSLGNILELHSLYIMLQESGEVFPNISCSSYLDYKE